MFHHSIMADFWKLPKKCLHFQCEGCENRNSFEYNKVSFYWFFADYYIRTFFLSSTNKDIIRDLWQKKQQSLVIGKRVWVHQWSTARQITDSFSTHRFYTVESFCRAWMIGKSCAFWNTSTIVQDENSIGRYIFPEITLS